jgi:polysaccharide export outer membrane protein
MNRYAYFALTVLGVMSLSACQNINPISAIPQQTGGVSGSQSSPFRQWSASNQPTAVDLGLDYRVIQINTDTIARMKSDIESSTRSTTGDAYGTQNYSQPKPFKPGQYRIGTGDELEVSVTLPASLSSDSTANSVAPVMQSVITTVDDTGAISIPQAGALKVSGLTLASARKKAIASLKRTLQTPEVFIRIAKYGSRFFSIGGAVRQPGILPMRDQNITITAAVQLAGGAEIDDLERAQVILRRDGQRYVLPASKVILGALDETLFVKPGDEIVVQEDRSLNTTKPRFLYVGGEVIEPQRIQLSYDLQRPYSLADILFEAKGWVNNAADPRHIYLIRRSSSAHECQYRVSRLAPAPQLFPQQAGGFLGNHNYASQTPFWDRQNEANVKSVAERPLDKIRYAPAPDLAQHSRNCVLIYQLNVENAANFVLATQIPVAEQDFIFVATKPISHWNATLGQILPSVSAASSLLNALN